MKKSKILIAIISILSIVYVALFLYYINNYRIDKSNKVKVNIPNDNMTLDKVLLFISQNKIDYLDNLDNSFTVGSITNQNKLRYVYYAFKDELDFDDGVSYTRIEAYLKSVFGVNANLKNEDVLNTNKEVLLYFDKTNEVYKHNKFVSDDEIYVSIYNYVVDFKVEKNNYLLKVNKFFINNNYIYGNVKDATNETNKLFYVDNSNDIKTYIKTYLSSNYNNIKDKLTLYEYNFTKESGSLNLQRYEKINISVKN